jgi:hypothetical protein
MTIIVCVAIFVAVVASSVISDIHTVEAIDVADTNRNQR